MPLFFGVCCCCCYLRHCLPHGESNALLICSSCNVFIFATFPTSSRMTPQNHHFKKKIPPFKSIIKHNNCVYHFWQHSVVVFKLMLREISRPHASLLYGQLQQRGRYKNICQFYVISILIIYNLFAVLCIWHVTAVDVI